MRKFTWKFIEKFQEFTVSLLYYIVMWCDGITAQWRGGRVSVQDTYYHLIQSYKRDFINMLMYRIIQQYIIQDPIILYNIVHIYCPSSILTKNDPTASPLNSSNLITVDQIKNLLRQQSNMIKCWYDSRTHKNKSHPSSPYFSSCVYLSPSNDIKGMFNMLIFTKTYEVNRSKIFTVPVNNRFRWSFC